jgi:primary-amine oxidase
VRQIEGKEPLLTPEDCLLAEELVKADPEIAAMLRDDYGITDLSLVACDPWSGIAPFRST